MSVLGDPAESDALIGHFVDGPCAINKRFDTDTVGRVGDVAVEELYIAHSVRSASASVTD